MKKLMIVPVLLALAACQTDEEPKLVTTRIEVVVPDASMYNCPIVAKYPDPDTLTDVQVAKVLVQLHRNNRTCKNSIQAIQKFLLDAEARSQSAPSPQPDQEPE